MSFLYPASRTPYSSAAHDLDHSAAPLLANHNHQQRSYYAAADTQEAGELKEEAVRGAADVEEGGRRATNRNKRPNYAAPVLPFPSPSRAATVTLNEVDGEAPYESPFSAFSAYQSDYSSPGDTLHSAYPPYLNATNRSPLWQSWSAVVAAIASVLSSVYAVSMYPATHPQQTAVAVLCVGLLLSSSGEQVTRKLLASSLYNYRYALFLLLSLASALLSTVLTLARWRSIRPYLSLSSLPPFLHMLLLVLLSAVASLLLLLSTAILPAPVALLFPQVLLPLSLLAARWWTRRQVKRDVSLGCALILLAIGTLIATAIYEAEAEVGSDAFVPSRAEICWNLLLLAVSVALSAAVWQVRASLLCAYEAHPLVMSTLVGWGQLGVGLLLAPVALWLQYLGTDRWRGVSHGGAGGGVVGDLGNSTLSSSSTGADSISSAVLLSSSMYSSQSLSMSASPSSTGASAPSSSSTTTEPSSSSASTAPYSSTSATSSPLASSSYLLSTAAAGSSSSVHTATVSSITSLSSASLLTSTAATATAASSSLVPPSLSSSVLSVLTLTSSYLFTLPATSTLSVSPTLSSYPRLLLPVIPSPDYLPAPTATATPEHHSFHASTLLNLQHFSRCMLFAHDSEYGDTCASPMPLLPVAAVFVLSCLTTQYAIAALSKRSSGGGGVSGVLAVAAVLAALCFVLPAVGVSGWLPYHQRVLLDGISGGGSGIGSGWWDGGLFGVCVVLLCVGCWLCGRQVTSAEVGVNVWERVEALMREQETARGSEDSRERRAAVRRARDRDSRR